jgi:hypothetical protein
MDKSRDDRRQDSHAKWYSMVFLHLVRVFDPNLYSSARTTWQRAEERFASPNLTRHPLKSCCLVMFSVL